MPGFDGTGPMGMGPMTGGGMGFCGGYGAPGFAGRGGRFGGRGRGGRGRRNMYYATGLTGWQRAAATVKAWHTRAFMIYWRWKSRKKPERPPITLEMRELIRKLNSENPLWGAGQIRDHILLLQYDPPCEDTIRKYMVKPRNLRGKSTCLPFPRNHMDVSWAIDFFTVNTIRFATPYVFIILEHSRRKVVHLAITPNPSMRWVIQQLREAMPYGRQPRFVFRDSDGIYGGGVRDFLDSCGIEEVRIAYRSPWQNPFVERFGAPFAESFWIM